MKEKLSSKEKEMIANIEEKLSKLSEEEIEEINAGKLWKEVLLDSGLRIGALLAGTVIVGGGFVAAVAGAYGAKTAIEIHACKKLMKK